MNWQCVVDGMMASGFPRAMRGLMTPETGWRGVCMAFSRTGLCQRCSTDRTETVRSGVGPEIPQTRGMDGDCQELVLEKQKTLLTVTRIKDRTGANWAMFQQQVQLTCVSRGGIGRLALPNDGEVKGEGRERWEPR